MESNNTKKSSTSTRKKSTTTTKTTTAKKTTAKVEPEAVEKETVSNVTSAPTVRKYSAGDLIPCKSVVYGELVYVGRNGSMYEWSGYGDICEVDYSDLLSMKTGQQKFLKEPWLIILDDELAAQWKLSNMNEIFNDIGDIEDLINSGASKVKKSLMNAPQGYKELVKKTAARMLREGHLDSIATVRVIDDILGSNLSMLLGG